MSFLYNIFVECIKLQIMKKEKDILIRIDSETKEKLREKAKKLGLSLSSYIRMLIIKEL